MTDLTFPEMIAAVEPAGDAYRMVVGDNWLQGRTTYGGVSAALGYRAMALALGDAAPLRSLLVNFVGPLGAGEATIAPRVLRAGKSVTQVVADVITDGQVATHLSAAFGRSRDGLRIEPEVAFNPEPRDSVPPMPHVPGGMPGFFENFEVHWTGGGIPSSGTKDRRLGEWVRHKPDISAHPYEALISIADVPPPVIRSHYTRPIPSSSLSWSLEILEPLEGLTLNWFYLEYTLEAAANGYSQQSGRIYAEDGTLLALSRQCMVYFE